MERREERGERSAERGVLHQPSQLDKIRAAASLIPPRGTPKQERMAQNAA